MFNEDFREEVECLETGWLKGTGWVCREEGGEGTPGWNSWAMVRRWDWVQPVDWDRLGR